MSRLTRTFDVIGVGRAAVDLYGEQIGGRLEDMQSFAKYLGGSPANTTVGASRLGLRAAMLTRVGDEHNGRFVRETLAAEGVDVSQVRTDPKRLTALVFLGIRDADTFPLVFYRDHCADMGLGVDDVEPAFIASSHARNSFDLRSTFSVAASTTSAAPRTEWSDVLDATRPRIASRSAAGTVPFAICRSTFFSIVARPRPSAPSATSIIVTVNPCCANTCAIPLPICPAPTTAM